MTKTYTFTFDNDTVITLDLLENASEADIRAQLDTEIAQGYHQGVDSNNTYTIEGIA